MRPTAFLSALTAATVLLTTTPPALATETSPGAAAAAAASSGAGSARTTDLPEATDRIVVKYETPVDDAAKERLLDEAAAESGLGEAERTTPVRTTTDGAEVLELADDAPVADVEKLAAELAEDPAVAWAEPDRMVAVAEIPGMDDEEEDRLATTAAAAYDPGVPSLWALTNLRAFEAWDTATGKGATIGVVDTGIAAHPDLDSKIIGGYDFVSSTALSNDGNGRDADARDPGTWSTAGQCYSGSPASNSIWHGTHVAGSAAARRDTYGTVGVAPDATILNARALGACGTGYVSDMADAVRWLAGDTVGAARAPGKRADVINMSLSMPGGCPPLLQSAINTAWSRNIPVVVAAGNWDQPAIDWAPGNCYNVITVGATGSDHYKAPYSNHGWAVDIYAPGHHILSSANTGTRGPVAPSTKFDYGTSMAAPHVAGTVALLKQKNPTLSAEQYKAKILDSGDPRTQLSGAKTLNSHDALWITPASTIAPATPTPSTPTYTTKGAIDTFYRNHRSALGTPTSHEVRHGAGVYQEFQKGTVYWSSASGTQMVAGGVRSAFHRTGRATGALGFPTAPERSNGIGGAYQLFQRGKVIWGPSTGGYAVVNGINSAYTRAGSEKGALGYPTSDERSDGKGGSYQLFQRGRIVWSAGTGSIAVRNAIDAAYDRAGATTGKLGYPTAAEGPDGHGGAVQPFQGGQIVWSAATAAHPLLGAVGARFTSLGGVTGKLGYPATDETPSVNGGVVQGFQRGNVYWAPGAGTRATYGAIGVAYADLGGPAGRLGYPTSEEYRSGTTTVQNFQGGQISWASGRGVRIDYR